MQNRLLVVITSAVVVSWASSASALTPIPKYLPKVYEGKPEYKQFSEKFAALKSKCDLCHKPGAKKTEKGHGLNDFGHAVHEYFEDGKFKALDKSAKETPADADAALKLLAEALAKAEADKNADGKSFGELMKAGELPGKNE